MKRLALIQNHLNTPRFPSDKPVNTHEYRLKAQKHMSHENWEFVDGSALDEVTKVRNCEDFNKVHLRTRVLKDMSQIDLSTTILGQKIGMPICIGPTCTHESFHPDGEKGTMRAAKRHETLLALSSNANNSLEEVADANPNGPKWFQVYVYCGLEHAQNLIKKAEKAGYTGIVMTVDASSSSIRDRHIRAGIVMPKYPPMKNLEDLAKKYNCETYELFKRPGHWTPLTWDLIKKFRTFTKLPMIMKGIQDERDAKLALECGFDAIWVSNHGGRMLDGGESAISLLPKVIEAVQGKVEVYFDSGVRRGTDVFKALALGAKAVFIGRPVLWGLAANGEEGVYDVLDILKKELRYAMAFTGCNSIKEINKDTVHVKF